MLETLMENWEHFLNSLATRGGNIVILLCVSVLLGFGVLHILHHGEVNVEAKTVVLATFSAFTGALLQALMGGSSRQRQADRNGEVAPINGNGVSK